MKAKKGLIIVSLLYVMAVFASPVKLGVDYTELSPVVGGPANMSGKIDVKEFFSFACIHCKKVEPLVDAKLAKNRHIYLERVHVTWNQSTQNLAKVAATINVLHLERLYPAAFDATFAGQNLSDLPTLQKFLNANKIDTKQFMAVYNSFTVNSKITEYEQLMKAYNITGTPTFVVAGRYVVNPAEPERLIEVVQYLVNKAAK